jgi:hypothetical protein
MTLDEAIPHCSEVAEELDRLATRDEDASGYTRSHIESLKTDQSIKCRECASDHRQLSEWLRELKRYKDERVGCEYCKHRFRERYERPCSLCKHNFKDMFEWEVNADE